MRRTRSIGLLGRILIILLIVMATEFVATTVQYQRASQFSLEEDDARRMAEHLVVARRVMDRTDAAERPVTAAELSTKRFRIRWSRDEPLVSRYGLDRLGRQILDLEPELIAANLRLHLLPLAHGGGIAGTMELSDRSILSFKTFQAHGIWSLTFGRILTLLAPTLALVLIGSIMIGATLRPLRTLIRATMQVGTDDGKPIPEKGPAEIRNLIHAFNAMQERIHRLINSRTQALAAVGHDLRTPLSRLQFRLGSVDMDPETEKAMTQDIEEMTGLLQSMQVYLSGQSSVVSAERVDLAVMASTLVEAARDAGKSAVYYGPNNLEVKVRPVAIRRALNNLIDNALHYGGTVRLTLRRDEQDVVILVEDEGPGIPEDQLAEVVHPFVRLDGARTRNTRGMGLGLSIVSDAVRAEGGTLKLENLPEGGLRVTIFLLAVAM
ncbi:MAG: ATP-binding protein [Sphingobium sp.]|uniref:ATP-binding protein n=1 Tax=Sphingobium sp. TaxID=1912891 RepID=UPI0029B9ED42|nr:ATP-binding protein [Sphingobium sp.]MDX3909971.1 ATP-binding protein [Sphingobium sp.]